MDITIAVSDFQHENWGKQFFPEDLPEDWRFDYYANEYDAVLLSEFNRQNIGNLLIGEMLAEANDDFLFVIEGERLDFDSVLINCGVLFVRFVSDKDELDISEVALSRAEIISQQNLSESACVLRVNSARTIKNDDIKQILMHVNNKFSEFDRVYLFLGQNFQDIEIINTTKIINDLL